MEIKIQRDLAIRDAVASPSARREMRTAGIHPEAVTPTGRDGRIMPDDVINCVRKRPCLEPEPVPSSLPDIVSSSASPVESVATPFELAFPNSTEDVSFHAVARTEERVPISPIRGRIAERILAARQQIAMLTFFDEVDLSQLGRIREKNLDYFLQRYGVKPGLMAFFVKACIKALKDFPAMNARIEGNDIVYPNYYDIGIAIAAEKGMLVPVLRNTDQLRLFEIEQSIAGFVEKIRHNQLSISELEGGTFTISNGGAHASLLSTPIPSPSQSGVLAMHAIQERPVVRDGQIVIRPMMYLALSHDHRITDGCDAVGFLRVVREYLEGPEELLLEE